MHMRVFVHLSDRRCVSLTKAAARGWSIPKVGKTILRSLTSIKAVESQLTRWSEPPKALVNLNLEFAICDDCVNDFKLAGPGARHGAPISREGVPRWFLIGHDLLQSNCVNRGVALDQAGIGEGCVSRRFNDVSFSD